MKRIPYTTLSLFPTSSDLFSVDKPKPPKSPRIFEDGGVGRGNWIQLSQDSVKRKDLKQVVEHAHLFFESSHLSSSEATSSHTIAHRQQQQYELALANATPTTNYHRHNHNMLTHPPQWFSSSVQPCVVVPPSPAQQRPILFVLPIAGASYPAIWPPAGMVGGTSEPVLVSNNNSDMMSTYMMMQGGRQVPALSPPLHPSVDSNFDLELRLDTGGGRDDDDTDYNDHNDGLIYRWL